VAVAAVAAAVVAVVDPNPGRDHTPRALARLDRPPPLHANPTSPMAKKRSATATAAAVVAAAAVAVAAVAAVPARKKNPVGAKTARIRPPNETAVAVITARGKTKIAEKTKTASRVRVVARSVKQSERRRDRVKKKAVIANQPNANRSHANDHPMPMHPVSEPLRAAMTPIVAVVAPRRITTTTMIIKVPLAPPSPI